jgi:hypothetical protein
MVVSVLRACAGVVRGGDAAAVNLYLALHARDVPTPALLAGRAATLGVPRATRDAALR